MDEYQIGDLVEATLVLDGREHRELLSYQPEPGVIRDRYPWLRLERGQRDAFTTFFATGDLTDIVPLVAVPLLSREQVVDALDPRAYGDVTVDAQTTEVLRLMGQPAQDS